MLVIGHRGLWTNLADRNQPSAFSRCFDAGFGTETDVRDRDGTIVIAHDPADAAAMALTELLDVLSPRDLPLALNVKADGLGPALLQTMQARRIKRWFTFDMSVPEMIQQIRLGLPVFTRASEHERAPACYDAAQGVWLDAFEETWFSHRYVQSFLQDGKKVCLVSPELHGRKCHELWEPMRDWPFLHDDALMLCTDFPYQATAWFGEAAR